MVEPFIGQILLVPYNFAPKGWAFCQGQLLPSSQYPALFSLIGSTYGGDGESSVALPDLRGRVALSSGQVQASRTTTWGRPAAPKRRH